MSIDVITKAKLDGMVNYDKFLKNHPEVFVKEFAKRYDKIRPEEQSGMSMGEHMRGKIFGMHNGALMETLNWWDSKNIVIFFDIINNYNGSKYPKLTLRDYFVIGTFFHEDNCFDFLKIFKKAGMSKSDIKREIGYLNEQKKIFESGRYYQMEKETGSRNCLLWYSGLTDKNQKIVARAITQTTGHVTVPEHINPITGELKAKR